MGKLSAKQHNKINRAIKALNDVRKEVQEENPEQDINWYLEDSNNLNLMHDESHDEVSGRARLDRIIYCYYLENSSGGGW